MGKHVRLDTQTQRKRNQYAFINSSPHNATYMLQWIWSALVQVMACRLFDTKPLPEPILTFCQLDAQEQTSVKFESKCKTFHSWKFVWKHHLWNGGHFVRGGIKKNNWHFLLRFPDMIVTQGASHTTCIQAQKQMILVATNEVFRYIIFPRVIITTRTSQHSSLIITSCEPEVMTLLRHFSKLYM